MTSSSQIPVNRVHDIHHSDQFFQNQNLIAANFQKEDFIYDQDAKLPTPIIPDDTFKPPEPDADAESIFQLYKRVGTILSKYTVGKFPDAALKHIPSMQNWEDVLFITEPHNWSPNAVYLANRIFVSNFSETKVERFYRLVLLPRVRQDIRQINRLRFALYQSLQTALQKPTAFCKGILIPLCESRTCTLREAVIVGSIIEKGSIPFFHLCVTLLKLAGMVYCGTISYFIKLLLEKKYYALPYRVLDALVAHFMRFVNKTRITPVIWHQSLLTFVQRGLGMNEDIFPMHCVVQILKALQYCNQESFPINWRHGLRGRGYKKELQKEAKDDLKFLLEKQTHELVTPEISRELNRSYNGGKKWDVLIMSIPGGSIPVLNSFQHDRFDISDFQWRKTNLLRAHAIKSLRRVKDALDF